MEYSYSKAEKEAREVVAGVSGVPAGDVPVSEPRDSQLGNLSSSVCFSLSKKEKKSPKQLAEELAKKIDVQASNYFEKLLPVNGYLNFFYSQKFFSEAVAEIAQMGEKFGSNGSGKGKTAIVEYSSPNVGKPMHVGHIRSTIIGDCLRRVYKFSSFKTIGMNYLCEAGMQTAKLILALRILKLKKPESEKDLLQYYVKIHELLEKRPELKEEARKIVEEMESGKEVEDLLKARELSCIPFDKNYARLWVLFDDPVYDSEYVEDGRELVEEAIKKGIAKKDKEGEVFADLEQYGLPNLVILRSNGTTLYSTRDLGLPESNYKKYKFDLRIYVVGSEQILTLKQSWKILELLGREYAKNLVHVPFGLICLKEGKLSTRKGRVLFLEDVLNDAKSFSLEEVKSKQNYPAEMEQEIAETVGVASIKYSVLKVSNNKNITFSIRNSVKFDGNTAAYLQYSSVRAKNILVKSGQSPSPIPESYRFSDEERGLVSLLSVFPRIVKGAADSYSPHVLCDYLFRLATQFSSFYNACPVIKAEKQGQRQARLAIVSSFQSTMLNGLHLLGIKVPEKM